MTTIHTQTINLRDISTRTVTLYPQKAEIVRQIQLVKLKPGTNEISITGVTPITDQNSIKVEASGSTIISDMVIELQPNPDHFDDVYESDMHEELDDAEDDEADYYRRQYTDDDSDDEIQALQKQIKGLQAELDAHQEVIGSNQKALTMLESFMSKFEFNKPEPEMVRDSVNIYQERRSDLFRATAEADAASKNLVSKIAKLEDTMDQRGDKLSAKRSKEKCKRSKASAKKDRAIAKQRDQKRKGKIERAAFWPKKVFTIKITIDLNVLTPGTSRRGSFDSLASANTVSVDNEKSDPTNTNLLLSYIVNGAFWAPKYELNISTVTGTGTVSYQAEIHNTTSETWTDARVILSTTRATFGGVSQPIPVIKPWLLLLEKADTKTFGSRNENPAYSSQERMKASTKSSPDISNHTFSRTELFGYDDGRAAAYRDYQINLQLLDEQNKKRLLMAQQEKQQQQQQMQSQFMQTQMMQQSNPPPPGAAAGGLFGGQATNSSFGNSNIGGQQFGAAGLFGGPSAAAAAPGAGLFGRGQQIQAQQAAIPAPPPPPAAPAPMMAMRARRSPPGTGKDEGLGEEICFGDDPVGASTEADPSWEESGMTTSFELPGTKTISPSSSSRKFKIVSFRLTSMTLTHVVVPKLKAEAFLRARIENNSTTAFLKGPAGLTLDGTFLGHTTIPRCSVGENFPLALGVDPAITVNYLEPVVRKNIAAGVFSKENSTAYTRVVILTNTRSAGNPVSITVKDQVPKSEDERLKIDIQCPKGLQDDGDRVKAGVEHLSAQTQKIGSSASSSSARNSSMSSERSTGKSVVGWGNAVAKLDKLGAIEWAVTLNPGKSVKLVLEYTTRYPASERVAESKNGKGFSFENEG